VIFGESDITLSLLKRVLPNSMFQSIMTISIGEAFEQLNVKNNLTIKQIEYLINDITSRFGYLKLDEVKHCIRYNIAHADIYDRLDSNIILKWFMDYDHKRDDKLIEHNKNAEYNENVSDENNINFEQHKAELLKRAEAGDEEAKEIYERYRKWNSPFEHIQNFIKKHNIKKH
jgi:hypothetical protein